MEKLKGSVERITYYNDENGYTVLRLRPEQLRLGVARDGTVTVVGALPELQPGEAVEFEGDWINDSRYGQQFKAELRPAEHARHGRRACAATWAAG